nr:MAG TPA: hypothetical protein [Caudoviricetes sp.]
MREQRLIFGSSRFSRRSGDGAFKISNKIR